MKFHDLAEKPSKVTAEAPSKPYYPSFYITQKQIPELDDYSLGDTVEFHVVTKVVSEKKRANEPKTLDLEMRKAAIINIKKVRKDAEEHGISINDMKEVDDHRKRLKKNKNA